MTTSNPIPNLEKLITRLEDLQDRLCQTHENRLADIADMQRIIADLIQSQEVQHG